MLGANHVAAFTSIIAAVVMTMIVVGIKNPGGAIRAIVNTSLVPGFTAIENIVFSYGRQQISQIKINPPHSDCVQLLILSFSAQ